MRHGARIFGVAAAVAFVFSSAAIPLSAAAQQIEMFPIDDLGGGGVSPQVIGGEPANPPDWPATLIFRNLKGGGCTATVVGPRTILVAAHCVDDNAAAQATIRGVGYTMTCAHHPKYAADYSADFALCLADKAIPSLPFEKVNTDAKFTQKDIRIRLLGYGCQMRGGTDKIFGVLYQGWADVDTPPGNGIYTVTRGGAAVCFGDSGGGAYVYTSPSQSKRVLVAVNSRGDIDTRSWLSTTSASAFRQWAEDWAAKQGGQKICGLHGDAGGCKLD